MSVADATSPPPNTILVPVASSLRDCIDAALTRLGYLYPTLSFERSAEGVAVTASVEDEAKIRRDVLHTIYRERILNRTITMRRTLIDGLMAS